MVTKGNTSTHQEESYVHVCTQWYGCMTKDNDDGGSDSGSGEKRPGQD